MQYRIYDNENKCYLGEPYWRWMISRDGHIYNSENDKWYQPDDKRFTIEQAIGIEDSDGKMIFEGDIVHKSGAYILWSDKLLCWCFKHKGEKANIVTPLFHDTRTKLNVLGTIHDE